MHYSMRYRKLDFITMHWEKSKGGLMQNPKFLEDNKIH